MIFVSYSHKDEKWRERFETMSRPLSRSESIQFWSDRNLKAGEWRQQIEEAVQEAAAAVLLVSDNFLASDFIVDEELPLLLQPRGARDFMIFWAYLEPCDLKRFPEITAFQAMTTGNLEPMSKMTDWEWKETMLRGCGMIDQYLKDLERPHINPEVMAKAFPGITEHLPLLAKPARRETEVLVYSPDKKWWRQPPIAAGNTTGKIYLGNENTSGGTEFPVVVLTTEKRLTNQTYPNIPDHRTKAECVLTRG